MNTDNITTSKLTLKDIGNFLSKLAERSESVYWLSSPDFREIQYISPAYEKIWGRPREILYTEPELWITYLHPDDAKNRHPIHEMAKRVVELGAAARFEESYRVIRPDGEVRWVLDRGFPVYDERGYCHSVMGVAIDITREKQIEEALRQVNLAKTEFLANMSHDLRTPLQAILMMTEVLQKKLQTSEFLKPLNTISKAGNELMQLIEEILSFSKLESGKQILRPEIFDLRELIEELNNIMLEAARVKNIQLHFSYAADVPLQVTQDVTAVKRILMNLLGNAIKFTQQGYVQLMVSVVKIKGDVLWLQFMVEDTGIGIPQGKLDVIFERFSQVESGHKKQHEGIGLGLAIVKQLVQNLGGEIRVLSKLGRGSVFTCVLPFLLQQ
jgi:PAS domain S-box-containing protein